MATRSINKVLLMGNLTRDPELRYTAGGTPVATFAVATNRSYVDSTGNNVESAEFTNIVAWAKLAEICSKILKKGSKVFVEGRLQTSKWNDKNTGQEQRRVEVVAVEVHLVSNPSGVANSGGNNGSEVAEFSADESLDFSEFTDSLPSEEGPVGDSDGGKNDNSTPF